MVFEELLRSPWFYSSPSPMSIIFHACIIWLGAIVLRERLEYKKHPILMSLTDSFFVVGFIVLSGDFIWMALCGLRFLPAYPDNLFLVLTTLGRDAAGMIFCFLLQKDKIGKVIKLKKNTVLWYVILIAFLGFNFLIATDPTWTDWTYAIRMGYNVDYIFKSFLVTWVGGKIMAAMLVYSWFKS